MKRGIVFSTLLSVALAVFANEPVDCCPAVSIDRSDSTNCVGLVLSGGGAKGIAEIGFIQALEDNDIPIDCITGTSMGSIVGSLYACGLSPKEMMELIKSKGFDQWSSGHTPPEYNFSFVLPMKAPAWFSVNIDPFHHNAKTYPNGDPRAGNEYTYLPTRLINPFPMSWAFLELYAPYTGQCGGDFNNLFVPLRTVASDIYHHKKVVFDSGQLSDAVRSSMTFPFVFQPIRVNGSLLFDGGLYDVYPVDVMMEDFNPDRVIGVKVSSPNTRPSINSLIGQIESMITNDVDYEFPDSIGVNSWLKVDRFGLLEWSAADSIYAVGYNSAMSRMDSIKSLIPWRRSQKDLAKSRREWKSGKPVLRFNNVVIEGASPAQERYIRYLLDCCHEGRESISLEDARKGFYRAASSARLRNLVPHVIFEDCDTTLKLEADVEPDIRLGVGGYVTSSAGSMLYGSVAYDPFALLSPGGSLQLWGGQCYQGVLATGNLKFPSRVPSQLDLQVAYTRECLTQSERMFYDFSKPAFLRHSEFYVKGLYSVAASMHGKFTLDVGYGHLSDRFSSLDDEDMSGVRHRFNRSLGEVSAQYHYSTLNDLLVPTSGFSANVLAAVDFGTRSLRGEGSYNGAWGRFSASALGYMSLGRNWSLGFGVDAYYAVMPLISDYNTALVVAPAFSPLASTYFQFDPSMQSNRWVAGSIHPVWMPHKMLQVRMDGWLYAPMRTICLDSLTDKAYYSKWFDTCHFLGEFSVVLKLPFAALRAYVDYRTTNAAGHFNGGISLGIPLVAPSFASPNVIRM